MTPLASLERFVSRARRAREGTRCELCGASIAEEHRHVVDRADRRLLCACTACVLAFDTDAPGRFRTVPERVRAADDAGLAASDLQHLGVPVGLAFFFRPSSVGRWVAVFPSVAGPTEAELPDGAWDEVAAKCALLGDIADDVEALLVHRRRDGRASFFVVPVDVCYELTGLLRRHWRGIDGGDEARTALDAFFARLRERSGGAS